MKLAATFLGLLKHSALASGSTPTPHLDHLTEFEEVLRGYRPSPETITILQKTPLVTLTAPTATGRNTIINELAKTGHYYFIISDTTRPPRMNNGLWEKDGREYYFRQEDDVLEDIRAGHFVEAEVIHAQQVSGISAREIERARDEGKIAITDVDIEGGINLSRLKPDVTAICLLPPSFEAWLGRINGREHLEAINLHRRLRQATKVLRLALAHNNFTFVINSDLQEAVGTVDAIAHDGLHRAQDEQKARALARQLYHQTLDYLRAHAPEMVPSA